MMWTAAVFCLLPAVGFSTVAINYVFEPTAKKKQVSDVTCCCVQEHGHTQENTNTSTTPFVCLL